jgi:phage gp16-like protein
VSGRTDELHRLAMLAKVHVARKQLGLDEASYRAVLARITGHNSAGDCNSGELVATLAEFERLGWSPAAGARRDRRPHVRKIWAIWGDLKPLLDAADDDVLRAFVRRQTHSAKNPEGIGAPEWLDGVEATKVIEGLKGWLARVQRERRPRSVREAGAP